MTGHTRDRVCNYENFQHFELENLYAPGGRIFFYLCNVFYAKVYVSFFRCIFETALPTEHSSMQTRFRKRVPDRRQSKVRNGNG